LLIPYVLTDVQQCGSPGLQKEYDLQLIAPCRQQKRTRRGTRSSGHRFRAHPNLQFRHQLPFPTVVLCRVLTLKRSIGRDVSSVTYLLPISQTTRIETSGQSAFRWGRTMDLQYPTQKNMRRSYRCESHCQRPRLSANQRRKFAGDFRCHYWVRERDFRTKLVCQYPHPRSHGRMVSQCLPLNELHSRREGSMLYLCRAVAGVGQNTAWVAFKFPTIECKV
jgi:hypothetical protein